ncbi:MAG TPA: hypothetical protein VG755_27590, partial [Nannocystaceae bacterium]|nr:hypothetical protein [Nannocystaceae bacterium]
MSDVIPDARHVAMMVCVCLAACGGKASSDTTTDDGTTSDVADTSAAGEDDPGDGPGTTPMDGTGPVTTDATEDTGPSDDDDDGVGFVLQPDGGGPANECDPKTQDCEDGQKCTAWSNDGGTFWNANKCVDVTGSGVAGDPCLVEGSGVSGIDDCDKGYICMNTDEEGMGTCVEFCAGQDEDCDPGNICAVYNDGVLPICLVGCDPLLQDCPEGQACIDTPNARFICFTDASGEIGQDGDACPPADGENSCDPGQWCGPNSAGCTDVNCCTPYCDLGAPACTAPDECVSFFGDPESAPPG